eukprot:COSAG02_NODE_48273_length_335_cov_0.580508_1_plen_49_part_01
MARRKSLLAAALLAAGVPVALMVYDTEMTISSTFAVETLGPGGQWEGPA